MQVSPKQSVRVYTLRSSIPSSRRLSHKNRRKSSQRSGPPSSASSKTARARSAFTHVFRKLLNMIRDVATGAGSRTLAVITTTLRVLCRSICTTLRVLFAPLRYARSLARMSTALAVRYMRTLLMCTFALWIVVFSWTDGALRVWAGEDVHPRKGPNLATSKRHTSLSVREKMHHTNTVLLKHLIRPLKSFLLFGIPQLTYELLRLWHVVLLHSGTATYDLLVDGVHGAVRLLHDSGADRSWRG